MLSFYIIFGVNSAALKDSRESRGTKRRVSTRENSVSDFLILINNSKIYGLISTNPYRVPGAVLGTDFAKWNKAESVPSKSTLSVCTCPSKSL